MSDRMSNKEIVRKFYEEVFNNGDLSKVDSVMKDDYIQHNPTCEDGKAGFLKFAEGFLSLKPHMEIIKIGEDEDMVYVFFKCVLANGIVNKVCDIYRLEDGMLAEHWDIINHDVGGVTSVNGNDIF